MASLLRNLADRFTPNASSQDLSLPTKLRPDGFSTARAAPTLFTPTKPDVDGDDCLHDCSSCSIRYPRKFAIDEDDKLYGEIKGFGRHLLVATGETDWVRDVEDVKFSVMQAVGKHRDEITGGRLMLSASNIPTPEHHGEETGPYGMDRPTRVLLLPSFQYIDGVTPKLVPAFIKHLMNSTPINTQPLKPTDSTTSSTAAGDKEAPPTNGTNGHQTPDSPPPTPDLATLSLPASLHTTPCPHKYLILLCSQGTRDARCGQSAPLLRKELERHLRPRGLYRDLHDERPGGVGIYFISHVGGHKYSANMMVYRRGGEGVGEAAQCIWLARIKPEDCENIVRYTILEGKVVKPESQLRGGFDREKGLVSW